MSARVLVAVLAGVALLAAGCGGVKAPTVAQLGTTTTSGSAPASNWFAAPPGGFGGSISTHVGATGVRFTSCMRAHGLPTFPDPDAQGDLTIDTSVTNPGSPIFQKALGVCQRLLPAGKTLSHAQQQTIEKRLLAFAACMRTHGVPHYPDPNFSNGGVSQGFGPKNGVDSRSPAFKAAQRVCRAA